MTIFLDFRRRTEYIMPGNFQTVKLKNRTRESWIMKETASILPPERRSVSAQWAALSPAEKKRELFRRQKELLATFLATGAISQAQHDRSLNCLIEKMGIGERE